MLKTLVNSGPQLAELSAYAISGFLVLRVPIHSLFDHGARIGASSAIDRQVAISPVVSLRAKESCPETGPP
jgi:hypothetical protein